MPGTAARHLIAPLTAILALTAGNAAAQTRCGASYQIAPGDTLYSVGQACGVSLSRIMALNPQLDPRALQVGAEVRLSSGPAAPRDDGARADTERDGGDRYTVRQGDTAYSIAQTFGISLIELMNQNPELEPFSMAVGEILDIPTGDRTAGMQISPRSGPPGSAVTVQASNLRPEDFVTIGVGPRASEWQALDSVRTDTAGRLRATVAVPQGYQPGDVLIFVVDTDRGITLKSQGFHVTAGDGDGRPVTLEGRVEQGVECPILRTSDGDVYALTSDRFGLTPGEYVEIEGQRVEVSFCQQGQATVRVTALREVTPPSDGGDRRDDGQVALEGRVEQGVECPVLRTPDGDVYALTSSRIEITPGEYVEIRGRKAAMAFCMQGEATIEVTSLQEVDR